MVKHDAVYQTYVQDEMWKRRGEILDLLMCKGAHLYVCGGVRMANSVCSAVKKMASMFSNKKFDLISELKVGVCGKGTRSNTK